jgi:hypothetical protein
MKPSDTASQLPTQPTPSWRDKFPIHPAAELFPRMSDAELAALGADIRKNGLTSPIVLWSPGHPDDGKEQRPRFVLDGISRLDAMERVGNSVVNNKGQLTGLFGARFQRLFEKRQVHSLSLRDGLSPARVEADTDPYAYVISANIHRRHLTAEQRRDLIAKLIKAAPEKSDRQIAETVRASHHTVGAVRAEMEGRGQIAHVEIRTDSKGRPQPARRPKSAAAEPFVIDAAGAAVMVAAEEKRAAKKVHPIGAKAAEKAGEIMGRLLLAGEDVQRVFARQMRVEMLADRDDIGPGSSGELMRLQELVKKLQDEKRQLEIKITGLESEIAELRLGSAVTTSEAVDADAAMLGSLLKNWDRAPEPVRQRFLARVGLVPDPLAIPPYLDRRTKEAHHG